LKALFLLLMLPVNIARSLLLTVFGVILFPEALPGAIRNAKAAWRGIRAKQAEEKERLDRIRNPEKYLPVSNKF
jgi:Sec-independent protein translocase protein TatA